MRNLGMKGILLANSAPAIVHMSAYANTLTNLIPDLYAGLDVVSRELVGYIPSVARSAEMERAAVGEDVRYHIAGDANVSDITPAMTVPNPTDQTIGSGTLSITKARAAEFGVVGEEVRGLNNGPGFISVQADMFAQAVRAVTNEVETDLAVAAAAGASRATGTAGTAPFASGVGDAAQLRKILDDNGAPRTGRSLIVNTTAGANLRTNLQLTKVNEAGTQMTLRDGELIDLSGISIKETGQAVEHTAGTGASATTDNAGYAVGATTITLASAGTGTILANDFVKFAGDPHWYQVVTGDADVSGGGTIVLAAPGLRQAIPAATTGITLAATYEANVGFSQNAIVLGARLPALPTEGDARIDEYMLTDPRSGLTFEVAIYAGYRKVRYEVALAWGVKVIKREHVALLFG